MNKGKAAALCVGDVTFISRFHRNCETLLELGVSLEAFSIGSGANEAVERPEYCRQINGRLQRYRSAWIAPFRRIELVCRLAFALWRWSPRLVVAHNMPAVLVAVLVIKCQRRKDVRLVYDAMELESGRAKHARTFIPFDKHGRVKIRLERYLASKADLVMTSDYARASIMQELLGLSEVLTCRNVPRYSMVPRTDRVRQSLGLESDSFVLLYQGLIAEGRGLEKTIECLAELSSKIVLVIMGFGDANYRSQLIEASRYYDVASRVFFLPAVKSQELLHWTSSASVILVLIENVCKSYFTAAPNKLYEAAMAGVPVISSDFPEIRAVLSKYPFGVMVTPTSNWQITHAIDSLYRDGTACENYRRNGLKGAKIELNSEKERQSLKPHLSRLLP